MPARAKRIGNRCLPGAWDMLCSSSWSQTCLQVYFLSLKSEGWQKRLRVRSHICIAADSVLFDKFLQHKSKHAMWKLQVHSPYPHGKNRRPWICRKLRCKITQASFRQRTSRSWAQSPAYH
ncbi:uncharacterized protein [Physcomitrium patens]|uniref:uncharacterized protein isoform X9 n=1 Tax=Physcomitrium patens TaxID=3218 RepID=UPI003CCD121B